MTLLSFHDTPPSFLCHVSIFNTHDTRTEIVLTLTARVEFPGWSTGGMHKWGQAQSSAYWTGSVDPWTRDGSSLRSLWFGAMEWEGKGAGPRV